jgi:hypothetical protein
MTDGLSWAERRVNWAEASRERAGAGMVVLAVGAILTERVTGFATGVGFDIRNISEGVAKQLVARPQDVLTDDKAKCVSAREKRLKELRDLSRGADAAFEKCVDEAKASRIKRFAPETFCKEQARFKKGYAAGREAWLTYRCPD